MSTLELLQKLRRLSRILSDSPAKSRLIPATEPNATALDALADELPSEYVLDMAKREGIK